MKSRNDKIIERIINKRNKLRTIPRASTLAMVKLEAVRRAKEDGEDRIIYMKTGAELCIRLVTEKKSGEQTSLCLVRHDGRIRDLV